MSSESNFSYTTKFGNDMFTVRGDTADEITANLMQFATVQSIAAFLGTLSGEYPQPLSVEASAVNNVMAAFPQATVVSEPANPVPPANAPSVGGGRTCVHGRMTAKQGVGKDGKTWRGYMCNAPQGATDKCKNVYIYPSMAEWHTFVAG